jgi:hypothetical protein
MFHLIFTSCKTLINLIFPAMERGIFNLGSVLINIMFDDIIQNLEKWSQDQDLIEKTSSISNIYPTSPRFFLFLVLPGGTFLFYSVPRFFLFLVLPGGTFLFYSVVAHHVISSIRKTAIYDLVAHQFIQGKSESPLFGSNQWRCCGGSVSASVSRFQLRSLGMSTRKTVSGSELGISTLTR